MRTRKNSARLKRTLMGLCAPGFLLATSCTADELRAVVNGIEVAASVLDIGRTIINVADSDHDSNFGQRLLGEIFD